MKNEVDKNLRDGAKKILIRYGTVTKKKSKHTMIRDEFNVLMRICGVCVCLRACV